jgi:hypothetical protein
METFRFTASLWRWHAQDGWFFVTVPEPESEAIRAIPRPPRGFGSVRVRVTAGSTTWTTSVFPDAKSGCYVLPVKKSVRAAERVDEGDQVDLRLALLE